MAEISGNQARPVSPHLGVVRWRGAMAMSVVHRLTGAALCIGMGLLAWWLLAAAIGPDAFAVARRFLSSWPGTVLAFAFSWALVHHAVGGLRHLVFDGGVALTPRGRDRLAWATLFMSIAVTLIVWAVALVLA